MKLATKALFVKIMRNREMLGSFSLFRQYMKISLHVRKLTASLGIVSLLAPSFAQAMDLVIITDSSGNSFTVASQDDGTVYRTVSGLSGPMGVAVSGTGAYFVNPDTNELLLYDTTNLAQERAVSIGGQSRRVEINGTGAYVVSFDDDAVNVIDISDFQLVTALSVGDGPNDVGFSGTGAYVMNIVGNSVTVIDTTDLQTVATVSIAGAPQTVAFYGTGAFVTRYSSSLVSVIDMTTNTVEWSFSSGANPRDIVIMGTGAYITNQFANAVSVVDVTDGVLVATISTGDTPFSINGTGTGVYVANTGEATVSVIDTTSLAVEDTIAAGGSPFGIAFYSDTGTAAATLIAPEDDSTVCRNEIGIVYDLGETPLSGSVQIQFYNIGTHVSTLLTMFDGIGYEFNLDVDDIEAAASYIASSTAASLPNGSYVVYLSYQDEFGNTAYTTAGATVTINSDSCEGGSSSSSSSSSSSEESESSRGGGGGGRRGSGYIPPRSTSSSSSLHGAASSSSSSRANVEMPGYVFKDVYTDDWFGNYVKNAAGLKIFEGYKEVDGTPKGIFGPSDSITLGQLAKVGTILRNKKDLEPKPTGDEWFKPYVGAVQAYDAAVFVSNPDPLKAATRGEVIHTILEALGIPMESGNLPYGDVPKDHPYASAIATATKLGFIAGDDGTNDFRPNDPINRAEVAKMLTFALAHVGITYEDSPSNATSSSVSSVELRACRNVLPKTHPVRATPSLSADVVWYIAPRESAQCEPSSNGWVKIVNSDGIAGYVQNIIVGIR